MATLLSKSEYELIKSRVESLQKIRARKMKNRTIADKKSFGGVSTPARKKRLWWGDYRSPFNTPGWYGNHSINPETDQC